MNSNLKDVLLYRIELSNEAFLEAKLVFDKKLYRGTVNRLYYSCFYIITAYLLAINKSGLTHTGVKALFNQELISAGIIEKDLGKFYNKLMSERESADYKDFIYYKEEEIIPMFERTERLTSKIMSLIEMKIHE